MYADSACAGNANSLHRYGATVPPDNLFHLFGRRVPSLKTSNLSTENARADPCVVVSLRRYKPELYGHSKVSLLHLKARIVKSEGGETLLYGCATWTPLKAHYKILRIAYHRMLLRILEAWCKSPNYCILSYKDAL